MKLELFSYWRSSASWRVRLALRLKNLPYATVPVHLLKAGGEQFAPEYRAISPEALVPSLRDEAWSLSQSLAICDYLEAVYPERPLLPAQPRRAAEVRSFCALIACDIHPLNNLRVLRYLSDEIKLSDEQKSAWYRHWIGTGFTALEARLANRATPFAFGPEPGLAECFLIPQLYNARRYDCALEAYPALTEIDARCATLPAFVAAHPDQQIDCPHA